MAGQLPMLTEPTMPPWIGIKQSKQTRCTGTQVKTYIKGHQGGTAAHANLTHPAAPRRNEIGTKFPCIEPMLTLMNLEGALLSSRPC